MINIKCCSPDRTTSVHNYVDLLRPNKDRVGAVVSYPELGHGEIIFMVWCPY